MLLSQNERMNGILELLEQAGRRGTPFFWVQRHDSPIFWVPPIRRQLEEERLHIRTGDVCRYGSKERLTFDVLSPVETIVSEEPGFLMCKGGHDHQDPEDWERDPMSRDAIPQGVWHKLFSDARAVQRSRTAPLLCSYYLAPDFKRTR